MLTYSDDRPAAEALLLDYAKRLNFHRQGRQAVFLHLSRLREDLRTAADINLTLRKARDVAFRYQGEVFHLANEDVVMLLKEPRPDVLDAVLAQICRLFRHDPLVQQDRDQFVRRFDMESEYEDFLDLVKRIKHQADVQDLNAPVRAADLDLNDPAFVQTATSCVHPNELVHTSVIYELLDEGGLVPQVTLITPLASCLEEVMLRGVDVASNPALLPHAGRLMERRLVRAAAYLADPWPVPWVIHVGLDCLISAEFMEFDLAWRRHGAADRDADPRFMVDFAEACALPERYAFARDYLQERGYGLWLGGVDKSSLLTLDLAALGAEAVRLDWPGQREALGLTRNVLAQAVARLGRHRVILDGCDEDGALDLARELGVTRVAGAYADAVSRGEKIWKVA